MPEGFDEKSYERIKTAAKRTLKIVELIKAGVEPLEIKNRLGVSRQLVDYYFQALIKK